MTETITIDIPELERRIRMVKIAVLRRQRAEGADTLMWSDPAYPEYCRRGRRLVAEMQDQIAELKAAKTAAMTRTAQPIVVTAPRGVTIEVRPLPNGWWRAIAGYTYAGLSGLHAVDAGIGDRVYAHEALLIALAKVREGAVDVVEKRYWSDVPATLTRQAEEILAFCDGRTRLIMEHPSTAPAKGRKKAVRKKSVEAEAPIAESAPAVADRADDQSRWRHALDHAKDRSIDELLATRHLTDDRSICLAVEFHLTYPEHYEQNGRDRHRQCLSVATARRILDALGVPEPEDRSEAAILGAGLHTPPGIADISVNHLVANAWLIVHGIEDGWMKRDRAGFLSLSEKAVEGRRVAETASEASAPVAEVEVPIAETPAPAVWTPPAWILAGEDDGRPLFAIADEMPDKHVMAWLDDRLRRLRIATSTVPPFEACIDLGRNLGASVQIRACEDGEAWEVAHDCEWGGGGYVAPFRGRYVTRRGAFSIAVAAIRKEARIPIEKVKQTAEHCIGSKDLQRANKILAWIDALVPPGPDEVGDEPAVHLDDDRRAA